MAPLKEPYKVLLRALCKLMGGSQTPRVCTEHKCKAQNMLDYSRLGIH